MELEQTTKDEADPPNEVTSKIFIGYEIHVVPREVRPDVDTIMAGKSSNQLRTLKQHDGIYYNTEDMAKIDAKIDEVATAEDLLGPLEIPPAAEKD